jgi:hypothetical protein
MRVLVATNTTQGEHTGDYCWTVEGELVTPVVMPCSSPTQCGCGRGFPGLASSRATTTALVADRPDLEREEVALAFRESLARGGWLYGLTHDEVDEVVDDHLHDVTLICEAFPVGSVVRRDGDRVYEARPSRNRRLP